MDFQKPIPQLLSPGIKILIILIAAYLIRHFLRILIKKFIKERIEAKFGEKERIKTLLLASEGTLNFLVGIVAILMILPELGINIAPLLTGLGLAGFAVGMAAKDIISDFIAGFFIILEGKYFIGDKVKIGGIEGEVVDITLRMTTLKDKDGTLYFIPNSQTKTVAKKPK